jgi:hypothetical protein
MPYLKQSVYNMDYFICTKNVTSSTYNIIQDLFLQMLQRALKESENTLTCLLYISNQTEDAANTTDVDCVSASFTTYLPGSRTARCRYYCGKIVS